jgi:hypothetical protein
MPTFFGTARNAGFDTKGGGGIEFDDEMMRKKIKIREKKNMIILSFSIKGNRDTFTCFFSIISDGSAHLSVSSNNKSPIQYQGWISDIPSELP